MQSFIQTQDTPNPNALKFLPGSKVSNLPLFFSDITEAKNSFLVRKLISLDGVTSIFLGEDFITASKAAEAKWDLLRPEIIMIIMDHFVSGLSVFDDAAEGAIGSNQEAAKINLDDLSEIEKQIVEIIDTRVRPAVAMDGGDIVYHGFENGVVKVVLKGACAGCPSSLITLKNGIESMLKYYLPEVKEVVAI